MTTTTAGALTTGHVGLNVSDLERSIEFYASVFGLETTGRSDESGREWAFLSRDGRLVLTLWKQSVGAFPADRPGLHHLSFQVASMDEVRLHEVRARQAGAAVLHDGVVAHGEGADSGGVFFTDPDGIRLEVFSATGATEAAVPTPGAPTCGFF